MRKYRFPLSDVALSDGSQNIRPSESRVLLALGLLFFAGLAGCGPGSSDNAAIIGARSSVGGPPVSQQSPSFHNNSSAPAVSPMPLASGNQMVATAGKGIVPGASSPSAVSESSSKPADVLEPLVVPDWIAKDLESPDVSARLRALDKWAQTAPPGADGPLILALDNKDERVRTRAMELIEQNWARAADAEQ